MEREKKITIIKPEKKHNKKKIAGYVRVSSDSADQLHSFQSQVNFYYEKISNMKDAILVDVYVDEGITGTRMDKRDGFNRMIDDCHRGKIDRIITKSINRFARNIVGTLRVLRELKALGVSVYFELENIDTAKGGSEVMISIYSLMAEQESKSIAMNQRWGFRNRAKQGIYNQSHPPYGYARNAKGEIIVVEWQADIVRKIYEMYVNQGMSVEKITAYLNENSIGERSWSFNGISLILVNERYCGDMLLQKRYTTDEFPYRLVKNRGDLPQYYVYDVFPKIIERELYQKSVKKITEAREKFNKNQLSANHIYPFTGIVTCLSCGNKFKRKTIRHVPHWSCCRHLADSKQCHVKAIKETELQEAFVSVYYRLKNNIFMLDDYMKNIKQLSMNEDDLKELQEIDEQLRSLALEKEELYHYLDKKMIDYQLFAEKMADIQMNKSFIEIEKNKLHEKVYRNLEVQETLSIISTLENTSMNEFDEMVFSRLVDSIKIDENSIVFHLRNDISINIDRNGAIGNVN